MNSKKTLLLLCFLCSALLSTAQDLSPKGWFHQNEAKLGEPIQYSLVLKHNAKLEFYFPDSTHDFSPFEYLERAYFPTQTDSLGNSYDSIVYTLATYELGQTQFLSVPIFIKGDKNPRPLTPAKDSISLIELIQELPDTVALFENTTAARVDKAFNYPVVVSLLVTLILTLVFGYIVFGDRIRLYFTIKTMKRKHLAFLLNFDNLIYQGDTKDIEPAIALWKSYSGNLMNIPLSSYTTKEIKRAIPEETVVINALQQADKVIYAGEATGDTKKKLATLKDFTQKAYNNRIVQMREAIGGEVKLPPLFKWLPAIDQKFAHSIVYSLFSFICYLIVFLWNKSFSALIFPFIAFLMVNFLSIVTYQDKIKPSLNLKEIALFLYSQAALTGLLVSIMFLMASSIYDNEVGVFSDLPSSFSTIAIALCIPLAKCLLASVALPIYYISFEGAKSSTTHNK